MNSQVRARRGGHDWAAGCLRSPGYDGVFIFGLAALALASGLAALYRPNWLVFILAFDILILGSQHVIGTYSRICFDKASFRRWRFLVLGAPWLALAFVAGLFMAGGTQLVTSLYMFVQWFHYVGQGFAVERQYACKFGPPSTPYRFDALALLAVAAVPLFGLLNRSLQKELHPEQVYLTFDFTPLPVTPGIVAASGSLAVVVCLLWVFRQTERRRTGLVSPVHTAYMLVHWGVFLAGYYLIADITAGWLVLNTWHNCQYLLMVWLFHNNRFGDRYDPQAPWLSTLSRKRAIPFYILICLALSGLFYKAVAILDGWLVRALLKHESLFHMNPEFFRASGLLSLDLVPNGSALAAAVAMLSYQVINVHHYMVDAAVWRVGAREDHVGLGLPP